MDAPFAVAVYYSRCYVAKCSGRGSTLFFSCLTDERSRGIVTDKETQGPLASATSISRRRFLKESALASAVVAIPYLAD
jgi:hypothetical protein